MFRLLNIKSAFYVTKHIDDIIERLRYYRVTTNDAYEFASWDAVDVALKRRSST